MNNIMSERESSYESSDETNEHLTDLTLSADMTGEELSLPSFLQLETPNGDSIHKSLQNNLTSKFQVLQFQYASFQREGYTYSEIGIENCDQDLLEKEFPRHLLKYLCQSCHKIPCNPQFCGLCGSYFCFRCFDQELFHSNICPGSSTTSNENEKQHQRFFLTPDEKYFFNQNFKIYCLAGCRNDQSKLLMDFEEGQKHVLRDCPYLKCIFCGHVAVNQEKHSDPSIDCKQEIQNFSKFLHAINEYQIDELLTAVNNANQSLVANKETLEIINTENEMLKNQMIINKQITNQLVEEIDQKAEPTCATEVNDNLNLNKITEERSITVKAICFETNPPQEKGFISVQCDELLKTVSHNSREQTWGEVKNKCLDLLEISPSREKEYAILELRCRVREDKELVKETFRSRNIVNLVPSDTFKRMKNYKFKIHNIKSEEMVITTDKAVQIPSTSSKSRGAKRITKPDPITETKKTRYGRIIKRKKFN